MEPIEEPAARPPIAGATLIFAGAVLMFIGIGFLTYAVSIWARMGRWPHYPASKMLAELGVPPPRLGWAGSQQALDWLLSLSSCTFLIGIGLLLAALGMRLAAAHARRQAADRDGDGGDGTVTD
jgi:uncharacterized membrane protein